MITNYIDNYYEYLKENIKEFNVEYLKKRIELEYIWTSFEHRKKGIASKLMDKMIEEKVNNITLEVRTTNEGAINLYKKYNFKVVSTRKNYYGNEDAYLMIREMM